jgi:hypothetical protein
MVARRVPPSASSALNGSCFNSKAVSRSEIAKRARSTEAASGAVLAAPWVVPLVATAVAQSKELRQVHWRSPVDDGSAIRMMAGAPKSRAACHFAAAIGLRSMLEGFAPEIPDWANDQHTLKGKAMGRGLDHFRKEGALLVPSPTEPDAYEGEAYRLRTIKSASASPIETDLMPLGHFDLSGNRRRAQRR